MEVYMMYMARHAGAHGSASDRAETSIAGCCGAGPTAACHVASATDVGQRGGRAHIGRGQGRAAGRARAADGGARRTAADRPAPGVCWSAPFLPGGPAPRIPGRCAYCDVVPATNDCLATAFVPISCLQDAAAYGALTILHAGQFINVTFCMVPLGRMT